MAEGREFEGARTWSFGRDDISRMDRVWDPRYEGQAGGLGYRIQDEQVGRWLSGRLTSWKDTSGSLGRWSRVPCTGHRAALASRVMGDVGIGVSAAVALKVALIIAVCWEGVARWAG